MSLLLFLASCDKANTDTGEAAAPENLSDCRTDDGDDFEYGGAEIDGDTLTVVVSYGGGCENHDFILCWPEQAFSEGTPVGARLELWHDNHRDGCEAYLTAEQIFDLNGLKQSYQEAYPSGEGLIGLTIGSTSLDYTF